MSKKYISLSILFFHIIFTTLAQNVEKTLDSLSVSIQSVGTLTNGDFAPFWLTNNTNGLGSVNNNNGYLRVGVFTEKQMLKDKLGISIGADAIVANNLSSDFFMQQLYADFKYRSVSLSIGAKERWDPYKNNSLRSGGMTLSNNARPIPQIEAGFPHFVDVPFTKGLVQVQGAMSYGWFDDDNFKRKNAQDGYYATKVLYHRKYGYFKFENKKPWNFLLGLEMDTQFGGSIFKNGEYFMSSPTKFTDFLRVLIPMAGGEESNGTDQVNILGNIYGSWHFIFNYHTENYSLRAYHEHFFEDHSGLIFKNMPDGIYGLEINTKKKKQLVSSALIEYIHTKNQSGPFLWDLTEQIPVQVSAGDNYYNHVDYISLSHHGFVVGNPLLTSPIYNEGKSLTVFNNRISAFHGGFSGYLSDKIAYRTLLTYSKSWGTHLIPSKYIRNQFSSLIELTYNNPRLHNWLFSGAVAYDNSKSMIGDNLGMQLKVSKVFDIK